MIAVQYILSVPHLKWQLDGTLLEKRKMVIVNNQGTVRRLFNDFQYYSICPYPGKDNIITRSPRRANIILFVHVLAKITSS